MGKALVLSMVGLIVSSTASLLAHLAGSDVASTPAIITGLSTGGAVGALVYIARKLVNGELVARDVAGEHAALKALVDRCDHLVREGHTRERALERIRSKP